MIEFTKTVTTFAAFVGLIYMLFVRADKKLRQPYKDLLSAWLRGESICTPLQLVEA